MVKQKLKATAFSLLIIVLLLFAAGCEKEDNSNETGGNIPVLITKEVTNITQSSATCGGNITSDGGFTVTERGVVYNTHVNPTIADPKTVDGKGAGSFTSDLQNLLAETDYYVRAYATNSQGTAYGSTMCFTTTGGGPHATFTDNRDGSVYKTITIGNQTWMAENLRYLPAVAGPGTSSETQPYYYVYGYNGTDVATAKGTINYAAYGVLYNWPAAMNGSSGSSANPSDVQGICPDGWHLPSDAEWTVLTDFLGGEDVAGGKMKDNSELYWISPNVGATNESGFTALPGGYRYSDGQFHHVGYYGTWWSTTTGYSGVFDRYLMHDQAVIYWSESGKDNGWSIRCVKD
ncbi:MAG: hypothetical protein JXA23_03450 [Bacteroidales bacterium]|nr:hypothetical protein [Bacteroidales bacterium]